MDRTLGRTLESMLDGAFHQHDFTYWYWIDGVLIDAVDLQPGRRLSLDGRAWCADDINQWLVPTQILIRFLDGPEASISQTTLRIGDAASGTLKDHRKRIKRRIDRPMEWLVEFEVLRPLPPVPLDVEPFVARLEEWTAANPARPVVGSDWEPLNHAQALQYILARAAEGCHVSLTETWLDRGPALFFE